MNSARLDLSFVGNPIDCYPEDRMADAIEAQIALTLPAIPGLVTGLTDQQRQAVLSNAAASQRLAFVKLHGSPFGNELSIEWVSAVSSTNQLPVAAT